ncbi:hypothetical protein HNQ51_001822 [Inhella inkyongensis]|uniref:DUF3108 domain-containing protein n=1 Tax=Inhella inkyongensis TaxID=392593 RepID=A0A840S4W0_9BURK|nr:DUF3108 domain-containing protein [Inhella inkyongensis]MBB5204508.1 hypothetical protein [Inhella inkyongensis]
MLLPGRRRNLKPTRSLFALGCAVALAHGLALWFLPPPQTAPPLPERLKVALVRPIALQSPPRVTQGAGKVRRLTEAAAARGGVKTDVESVQPALPAQEADLPLRTPPPLDLGAERADEPGPEWPLSSRLRYGLTGHYQGPVHGDAEVEWLRQGARYQVRLMVSVGPRLAPFMRRTLVSEGRLGAQGIAPQRFSEETRMLLFAPRRLGVELGPTELAFSNGRRERTPAGVQDSASQFAHLSWLLLTGRVQPAVGVAIDLPLALPARLQPWRYELEGLETVETPLGALPAWKLAPRVTDRRGALLATVWLAPQLQYLPVRIDIQQDEHTQIRLVLAEPPLQEAARPSADNANHPEGDPKP